MNKQRLWLMLALRGVIFASLILIAVRASSLSPTGTPLRALLGFVPAALLLLPVIFAFERRPSLRPLRGLAWVAVFDLAAMGVMVATLGESAEPELMAFLLLGLVVATSRDLLAGFLAGGMAWLAFGVLGVRHGLYVSLLEHELLARGTLFLACGLFTGFLSREAEQERAQHARQEEELKQELSELGESLKDVLASVSSGVLVVDGAGQIKTYNRAAARILGVPEHKVVGRTAHEIGELAQLAPMLQPRLQVEGKGAGEERRDEGFTRPDGRRVRIGFSRTALENLAGRRMGVILVFQDVTLIRDYEERMLRQEQLAALGRLVSGIAHEFGNLLGGARGLVDLVLAGDQDDANDMLPVVRDTLDRALSTVENLLKFARGTPIERLPGVDLREVLDGALKLLSAKTSAANVTVERNFAEDVPTIEADAGQLQQVFVNLLINGLHAVQDRTEPGKLRLGIAAAGDEVILTFEDNGPGVSEEIRAKVFEPFFTTKGALGGSETPGTGLGLAIASGVIQSHAGRLDVDVSPYLAGARFTICLPSTAGDGDQSA